MLPEPLLPGLPWIESHPLVADAEDQPGWLEADDDLPSGDVGMPPEVGEAFLDEREGQGEHIG
jgi:hypothetical protein